MLPATAADQVLPSSFELLKKTPCASDHTAYRFPFVGSTARLGKTLLSAMNSGAWYTRVAVHVSPPSVLFETRMLLKFALVPFCMLAWPEAYTSETLCVNESATIRPCSLFHV